MYGSFRFLDLRGSSSSLFDVRSSQTGNVRKDFYHSMESSWSLISITSMWNVNICSFLRVDFEFHVFHNLMQWWLVNESPSVKTLLSCLQSEEKVGKEWPELLAPLFRLGFSTNTSISTNNYTSTISTKTESTTLGNKGCRWGEGQRGTVGS